MEDDYIRESVLSPSSWGVFKLERMVSNQRTKWAHPDFKVFLKTLARGSGAGLNKFGRIEVPAIIPVYVSGSPSELGKDDDDFDGAAIEFVWGDLRRFLAENAGRALWDESRLQFDARYWNLLKELGCRCIITGTSTTCSRINKALSELYSSSRQYRAATWLAQQEAGLVCSGFVEQFPRLHSNLKKNVSGCAPPV